MMTIEAELHVDANGEMSLETETPPSPGTYQVEVRIKEEKPKKKPLNLPPPFDVGEWPEGLSLRREDMYD